MITKFQMETQQITADGALRAAKKNEQGWYQQIPVFVFGKDSRNGWGYDVEDMTAALTQPGKYFYEALKDGVAHGEYGHPDFSHCTTAQQMLMRMANIEKTRMSHVMANGKIVGKSSNGSVEGGNVFCVDIKPIGPMAEHLDKELSDPDLNATFSARTILKRMQQYHSDPRNKKKVDNVPGFDSVSLNGYAEASKRGQIMDQFTMEGYSVGRVACESIEVEMRMDDLNMITEIITTENITAGLLLDSLKADLITVKSKNTIIGTFEDGDRSMHTHQGRASLIHTLYHGRNR